jgi:DNA replication protein DnaC
LRLSAVRALAPELLVTAQTQRWKPEEFLRTLIEAEIASRDLSNARARMKVAAFPVKKTLEEFDVTASSVKRPVFDYLSSLEWIRAKENLCLVGPAGTGKSHLLIALGHHAIETGHRVRYFTAADLIETLYRALADNFAGKVITQILKSDLIIVDEIGFAPMDSTGAELFFRLVAAAYERCSLGIGSHWPFEEWGKFLPEHTTAVSLLDRLRQLSLRCISEGTL